MSNYSIVEYFGEDDDGGHKCGYCKGRASSLTHGMWGHGLSNRDYQDLIDRGWRRSGRYLYKPIMDRTCCPQYTIRCQVDQFRPSKSHKKVLKRFRNFVINGRLEKDEAGGEKEADGKEEEGMSEMAVAEARMAAGGSKVKLKSTEVNASDSDGKTKSPTHSTNDRVSSEKDESDAPKKTKMDDDDAGETNVKERQVRPGVGADPNKPRARKAKDVRRERALAKKGVVQAKEKQKEKNQEKSLADFLDEPFPAEAKHKFEIRTVWAQTKQDASFKRTFQESLKVYQKYQTVIHGDKPAKVTADQFTRFLCDASLFNEGRDEDDCCEEGRRMGGFHQQYLIDGKIFCVGVVDILPRCLSSVYLFYDPAFAFLSPGTLSALFELHFARRAALPFYYMGFYIHDCPKMRYKAGLSGSYLLCPEQFSWVPVANCVPVLDKAKYSKLSRQGDETGTTAGKKEDSMILYNRTAMPFRIYSQVRELSSRDPTPTEREDDEEIAEYARLVGSGPTGRMLLFRA